MAILPARSEPITMHPNILASVTSARPTGRDSLVPHSSQMCSLRNSVLGRKVTIRIRAEMWVKQTSRAPAALGTSGNKVAASVAQKLLLRCGHR